MPDPIRFTVVVPTRERADVLPHCLRTLVEQDYEPLDILVSDNFSGDDTRDVVASFADPRIRYVNTGRRLSMSDNWEFALGHVRGGWLTILGDDDGLLPDSLARVAEIARATGALAVRSRVIAYRWPSLTGESHGRMDIPSGRGVEIRRSDKWLRRVLDGRASYLDLPMLYNGGFVDYQVLETIRDRSGRFYRSCIPDVYMAIAVARVVDRYAFSRAPLAVNGASRHSTGTSQFSGAGRTGESPAGRFMIEGNMPFHPDLPLMDDGHYPSSFQALVYESWRQTDAWCGESLAVEPARQLELILATAGRYRAEMERWGQKFAALHGLDFATVRARAGWRKVLRRPRSMLRKLSRKLGVREAGSPALRLEDVHEASLAAARILAGGRRAGRK